MYQFILVAHIALGLTFLTAAVTKSLSFSEFVTTIQGYTTRILPFSTAKLIALILLPFEYLLGICFFLGIWPRVIALLATGILLIFSTFMFINIQKERYIHCNCFGIFSHKIGFGSLLRNIILIIICILIMLSSPWISPFRQIIQDIQTLHGNNLLLLFMLLSAFYILIGVLSEVDILFHHSRRNSR